MKNLYLKYGIFENKFLVLAFILGTLMQIIVVIIPQIANIFELVPLNKTAWLYTIIISILPIVIIQLQKKLNEIKFGKIIYKNEIIEKN